MALLRNEGIHRLFANQNLWINKRCNTLKLRGKYVIYTESFILLTHNGTTATIAHYDSAALSPRLIAKLNSWQNPFLWGVLVIRLCIYCNYCPNVESVFSHKIFWKHFCGLNGFWSKWVDPIVHTMFFYNNSFKLTFYHVIVQVYVIRIHICIR